MDILRRYLLHVLQDNKKKTKWRVFATALSAVIVFVTTYSLILPAITMDTETAETMAGFDAFLLDDEEEYPDQPLSDTDDSQGILTDDPNEADIFGEEDAGSDFDSIFADEDEFTEDEYDFSEEVETFDEITYDNSELESTVRGTEGTDSETVVRLSYDANAWIPDGTELVPYEITPGSWMYSQCQSGSDRLQWGLQEDESNYEFSSKFFQLNLIYDDEMIEPANGVYVKISFADPIEGDSFRVVRFEEKNASDFSEATECISYPVANVQFEMTGDGNLRSVSFEMDQMSVIGIQTASIKEAEPEAQEVQMSGETEMEAEPEAQEVQMSGETEMVAELETQAVSVMAEDETEDLDNITGYVAETETEEPEDLAETETEELEDITEAETEELEDITEAETEELEDITEAETEEESEDFYPAQDFSAATSTVTVKASAPEGAFPEGTTMSVEDVEDEDTLSTIENQTADEKTVVKQIHAVDITFRNSEGEEIEPLVPIRVEMTPMEVPAADTAVVVHVDKSGNAETVEQAEQALSEQESSMAETIPENSSNQSIEETSNLSESIPANENTVAFDASAFSVYAIVYTVDFHWEVNGKMYEFSIPGGGFVSLEQLVEVLGIAGNENDKDHVNEAETAEHSEANRVSEGAEENGTASDTNEALTLYDVEISETTKNFVAGVETVGFSSPELVDVSHTDENTTVGQIKESRGLECQYSADLTQEQIEEINAQAVNAGDWVLISLLPFTSEEMLTVTMKNGEVFSIRVTDYQISANVLTADGRTYRITVTYDDDAEIPVGTRLVAEEIESDSDEYMQHLGQAWSEVNREYLEQEEEKQRGDGGLDDYEDIRPVNLDDARFFHISLIYNEEEIEPKAPVQVDIQYVDGLETSVAEEETVIGAAHFLENTDPEDGTVELITAVDTVCDEDGKYVEFAYEQDSFSDIGTYVGQKTYDNVPYKMSQTLALPLLQALTMTKDEVQLEAIEAHKSLTNNHDGTYTMSLTVKGDAAAYEEYNKANILFVMDRSSSMTSNSVGYEVYSGNSYNSNTTYYRKNGNVYEELFIYNGTVCTREWNPRSWSYNYTRYTGTVYTAVTRLAAEQAAMDVLIQNLLAKNDPSTPGKEDLIELSVISFADQRMSGNTEYTGWTASDYTGLMAAVNRTNTPSGTNWEDALIYAKEQAAIKKQAQPDEDVYVIFLTDGEPTAVYGESGGAHHYNSDHEGGFEYALTEVGGPYNSNGRINDGKNSLDRAKEIVDAGYKLYGIFTFNPGEAQTRYLRRLMNFAYTGVDKAYENDATKEETAIVKRYFTNADTPEALTGAFEKIFADVANTIGHGDVVITDGLTAADAMTTTIHANRADGFRYSVTNDATGEELYYVTATGADSSPSVTFHIDGQPYPAGASKEGVDGKPYYSVTVNGREYKMALADLSGRELTWDLSAVGILLPGCTYKVDIIVWPNQAAYDYVAGLNNQLPGYVWNKAVESNSANYHEVTVDGNTYGYYTGGVPGHDSIVKYKDSGVFSVLTNTHQELNYSIVNTKTNEVTGETTTISDPQEPVPLEPQKPMDLVDTSSSIEKQWNIDLDPSILAQLLYPADGTHYTLTFDILQDTATTPYKTLTLGWDAAQNRYVWESGSERDIEYNGTTYSIGTVWKKDFAVPTGLMLSGERMDALGMDKSAYPSGTYPIDPENPNSEVKTYYILEDGHDYTIKERNLSYEFDFNADVFHPMLVDGEMQNVIFTKTGDKTVSITDMTNSTGGLSSLKVENTLRGYIHLEKHVVNGSGAPVDDDKTKFEYTIELTNDDAVFVGTHIPWYGINGLYYHDRDFNYYQVYYENNVLKIRNEAGVVYAVTGSYDLNEADEQPLTYLDGEERIELLISGNQTTASNGGRKASTVFQISQGEILSIANIPAGTQYVIAETQEAGYELVNITKHIDPDDVEEDPAETTLNLGAGSITGTIVPNHHNYIDYTNRRLVADITIQKVDDNGTGLQGAVFQLKTVSDEGHVEELASEVDTVSGIGEVSKEVNGETIVFPSSFETTGGIQKLSGLPAGTYRLYEVYVPAGYVNTIRYIQFEIEDLEMKNVTTDTGDMSKVDTSANDVDLIITNTPGAALPNTGGPGTGLVYLAGLMMMFFAGSGLAMRRRRGREA